MMPQQIFLPIVSKISDNDKERFRAYLPASLKCTVSPGESKGEKLLAITRKLVGPGIVIASEEDQISHIAEYLDSASILCTVVCLAHEPEENRDAVESCRSGDIKLLVIDQLSSDNLPLIPFKYIVHWGLPQSLREYVSALRHFENSKSERFAILLYDPADRYIQEEIINRKYGSKTGGLSALQTMLAALDAMEEYAAAKNCRIQFIKNALGIELQPQVCRNCDNCRKNIAEESLQGVDYEKIRILLHCIMETREKFGMLLLIDVLRGNTSKRIIEYNLDKAATFGTLHNTRRKDIVELFNYLIFHGYLKRTTGTYPALYLTSLGKKLLSSVVVQPLELPKKMTIKPGEQLDVALLEAVRNYRRSTAKQLNISSFMVFQDAVLKKIVMQIPQTEEELKSISGFGENAWKMCGERLLKALRSYTANNA